MKRAVATRIAETDPAAVVQVIDSPMPEARDGWALVKVKATSLNQHDLWAIKGVGVTPERFPLGLGSDVAGVTSDGRDVVVHSFVTSAGLARGGELLDPTRTMLAEVTGGGAAEWVLVPERNLVEKPASLSFESAASLPTAWLTAYHMLFRKAKAVPGSTVLIQGAGGGVSTAAIMLAAAAGLRVWVTGRDEQKLERARELGAHQVFSSGTRLPERVDIVLETVGAVTWDHSVRCVRPGGVLVVAGATTGGQVTLDLNKVFLQHVSIIGSSLGTIDDLRAIVDLVTHNGIQPPIDSVYPLADTASAVARLASGEAVGKIIVVP